MLWGLRGLGDDREARLYNVLGLWLLGRMRVTPTTLWCDYLHYAPVKISFVFLAAAVKVFG